MVFREQDLSIFNLINPKDNDKVNKLKNKDLIEFLDRLDKYLLEFRELLNINIINTFGIEVEYDEGEPLLIKGLFFEKGLKTYKSNKDGSVRNGGEINSPVLTNTKDNWKELDKMFYVLKSEARLYGKTQAGGHIHVGSQILGLDSKTYLKFCMLWATYENVLIRFFNGEYLTTREEFYRYSKPVANMFRYILDHNNKSKDFYEQLKTVTYDQGRYVSVNFNNNSLIDKYEGDLNTIEFRCPNPSLNSIIWQNNINVCIKLLERASKIKINDIAERYESNKLLLTSDCINDIYLKQALELCDLLFDNNLDKIYFLRQYIKSFEISKDCKKKAKRFTV